MMIVSVTGGVHGPCIAQRMQQKIIAWLPHFYLKLFIFLHSK